VVLTESEQYRRHDHWTGNPPRHERRDAADL